MLLASVTEIREQLGFDDMVDVTEAIRGALLGAEPLLSARLNTSFNERTLIDTFYIHEPGFYQGDHVETEFRLTQGFVQTIVSATASARVSELGGSGSTDVKEVFQLHSEKGVISDFQTRYVRSFMRVEYTCGFPVTEEGGVPTDQYDPSVVPGWLREAARLQALIALENHPTFTETATKVDVKTMSTQLNAILAVHQRYAPMAKLPL